MAETQTPPAEGEEITDPGTTLGTSTPVDSGITDPGTTLGLPVVETKKTAKAEE